MQEKRLPGPTQYPYKKLFVTQFCHSNFNTCFIPRKFCRPNFIKHCATLFFCCSRTVSQFLPLKLLTTFYNFLWMDGLTHSKPGNYFGMCVTDGMMSRIPSVPNFALRYCSDKAQYFGMEFSFNHSCSQIKRLKHLFKFGCSHSNRVVRPILTVSTVWNTGGTGDMCKCVRACGERRVGVRVCLREKGREGERGRIKEPT